MQYSIILFVILFIIIWVMHKPFDVHNSRFKKLHEYLEYALIIQGMIVLNKLLNYITI